MRFVTITRLTAMALFSVAAVVATNVTTNIGPNRQDKRDMTCENGGYWNCPGPKTETCKLLCVSNPARNAPKNLPKGVVWPWKDKPAVICPQIYAENYMEVASERPIIDYYPDPSKGIQLPNFPGREGMNDISVLLDGNGHIRMQSINHSNRGHTYVIAFRAVDDWFYWELPGYSICESPAPAAIDMYVGVSTVKALRKVH